MKSSTKPAGFTLSPEGLLGRLALATLLAGTSGLALAQPTDAPPASATPTTEPSEQVMPENRTSVAPAQTGSNTVELERVVVTGSSIARTSKESASPLQIIGRREIEASGKQSVAEVIRGVTADNQGSLPTAFGNGFAAGAAGVSLRGLGLNSTLVLVNGRRMAPYGLADDGARTFVDLNSIPLEAVDRVEVLKDGASAIYGSDAVGGVVNIILRRSYVGGSVSATGGISQRQDGNTGRISATYGFGDLGADRYNVFVTAEIQGEKAIYNQDRGDWIGTRDTRRFGGYDLRPGANSYNNLLGYFSNTTANAATNAANGPRSPAFNGNTPYGAVRTPGITGAGSTAFSGGYTSLTPCPERNSAGACVFDDVSYLQITPKVERRNIYARGTYAITPNIQTYVELGRFGSETTTTFSPSAVSSGNTFNPNDPLNPILPVRFATLPANHPDNPYPGRASRLFYRTAEFGPRSGIYDSNVNRLLGGLKGSGYGWDFDIGALYIQSTLDRTLQNYTNLPAFQAALNAGYRLNNPAANNPALIEAIAPDVGSKSKNSVASLTATASRSLFNLPGGPLSVAIGGELRKEKTNSPAVPGSENGDLVGGNFTAFSQNRNVYAAYAELVAPIVRFVELSGAVRYDRYSDYGSTTNPKVGIKITPIKQISLRGTYSEAFRAPGPSESGNTSSLGFAGSYAIINQGDPGVQPERAKSFTAGLVVEPLTDLSATLDYYRIDRRDEIIQADAAVITRGINQTGPAETSAPGATPGSRVFYDINGQLSTVSAPYTNGNKTLTSGVDVNLRYRFGIGRFGRLTTDTNWTHIIEFTRELDSGETFEYAGYHGPFVLSSAGGTPKDRIVGALTWDKGDYSATLRVNYVSSLRLEDYKGAANQNTVDLPTQNQITTGTEGYHFPTPNGATPGVTNPTACSFFNNQGQPFNDCKLPSFTTFDLTGRWALTSAFTITGGIRNLLDKQAPFDPYTYGGNNYNPTLHQDGAVGRFYTAGIRYTFK